MVRVKDKVLRIIRAYLKEVEKAGIRIERAYLYGSYARGEETDDSDIDIAIVSSDFSEDRFTEALRLKALRLKALRWNIDMRIEPMPILPEDFNEGNPLVSEILSHGILIKPSVSP